MALKRFDEKDRVSALRSWGRGAQVELDRLQAELKRLQEENTRLKANAERLQSLQADFLPTYLELDAHPQAAVLALIAMGHPGPWEYEDSDGWRDTTDPLYRISHNHPVRLKNSTMKIGSQEVPAPERTPLRPGMLYWSIGADGPVASYWGSHVHHTIRLKRGNVWRQKEQAQKAFEALGKLMGEGQ